MQTIRNVAQRFAFLIALPAAVWVALEYTVPTPVLLNLFDAILFFVSFFALAAYAPRTAAVFRSSGAIDTLQWLTMALAYFSVSCVLAVVWSVRWRATGHAATFTEDDLRGAFRYVAILGTTALIVSQGDYEVRVPPRRWATIVALFLAALSVVALAVYGDSIRTGIWPHDIRPGSASGGSR